MANFFKGTITLFILNSDNFDKYIVRNVYFRYNIQTRMTENGLIKSSGGSITIPIEYAQIGDLNLNELSSKNTYVAKGEINEDITYKDLVKNYHLFRVVSVADNRKGGLQHIKLEVEA